MNRLITASVRRFVADFGWYLFVRNAGKGLKGRRCRRLLGVL